MRDRERVREAAGTGADPLAVACPFCTLMFDEGVRSVDAQMRGRDVSTLLADAVE